MRTENPSMIHAATTPPLERKMRSSLPSPLTSPTATRDQPVGTAPTTALLLIVVPFICHTTIAPPASTQTMSALPSPFKSPVPATLHVGPTPAMAWLTLTVLPFNRHSVFAPTEGNLHSNQPSPFAPEKLLLRPP